MVEEERVVEVVEEERVVEEEVPMEEERVVEAEVVEAESSIEAAEPHHLTDLMQTVLLLLRCQMQRLLLNSLTYVMDIL